MQVTINEIELILAVSAFAVVASFGVLVLFVMHMKVHSRALGAPDSRLPRTGPRANAAVYRALEDAVGLNPYDVYVDADPAVHLGSAVRVAPRDFHGELREISDSFRAGRVLAIDLRAAEPADACRLVDFCSGMAAVHRGWIFRVTDDLLVVAPLS